MFFEEVRAQLEQGEPVNLSGFGNFVVRDKKQRPGRNPKTGKAKRQQAKLQWPSEGKPLRPGLRQLRPEDLPPDVAVSSGYDHRGHCYTFEHKKLGELGRIVMIQVREQEMVMQAELYQGQDKQETATAKKKRKIFEDVVATVNACFAENFPRPVS